MLRNHQSGAAVEAPTADGLASCTGAADSSASATAQGGSSDCTNGHTHVVGSAANQSQPESRHAYESTAETQVQFGILEP